MPKNVEMIRTWCCYAQRNHQPFSRGVVLGLWIGGIEVFILCGAPCFVEFVDKRWSTKHLILA